MSQLTPKKKLYSISPSQVASYRQCPRLWFYASVLNDRGPSSRSQVLGEAVHKALEIYMQTGEVLPTVTLPAPYLAPDKVTAWIEPGHVPAEIFETLAFVQAAIDYLPPHGKDPYWSQFPPEAGHGVMVEQQGEMGTYEGGPNWNQYIDLVVAQPGEIGEINDFKTRSAFRYNKTPDELAHDVQMMSNARWLFLSSDYKVIRLRHLNLLTRGRTKCVPVEVIVTREQVEAVWQETLATVREMEGWAAIASEANALPPNTESCDMYGGCRKRQPCGFDQPLVNIRSPFSMSTPTAASSALLSSLLAGKGAPVVTPTPAASPPTAPAIGLVVPLQGAPVAPGASALGSIASGLLTAPAPAVFGLAALLNPAKAAQPLPVVVPPSTFQAAAVAAGYPVDFAPTGSISPPDAPPPTSTPEQVAVANPVKVSDPAKASEAAPEDDEAAQESGTAPASTDAPAKRRRRTKAEMEAARSAAEAVTSPSSVASYFQGLLTQVSQQGIAQAEQTQVGSQQVLDAREIHTVGVAGAQAPSDVTVTKVSDLFGQLATGGVIANADASQSVTNPATPPVDPITTQIKHRLNTPDPSLGCPVKFVFIDCMPGKGWPAEDAPIDAREFWHAIAANASAAAKVADYRFIPYTSKGYLSASVRAMLRGLPASIYVDSAIPDIQELLTAVIPYASLVVRGR